MEKLRSKEIQQKDGEQGQERELTDVSWVRGLIFGPWWLFSYLLQWVMGQCVRKRQKSEEGKVRSASSYEKLSKIEINREKCPSCVNHKLFKSELDKILEENDRLKEKNKKLEVVLKKQQNETEDLRIRNGQLENENCAIRERCLYNVKISCDERDSYHNVTLAYIYGSDELTKKMATTLEKQSIFEDVSNPLSGMKLADRMNSINAKEFESISVALEDIIKDEVKVIRLLKTVMVTAYKACCEKADQQIRQFLFLSEDENVPSQQEFPELYKMRCIASIQNDKKERVVQDIVKAVVEQVDCEEHILDAWDPKTVDKLTEFVNKFTDCCWLMTVADKDQLILNFDVIGQEYKGNLSKQFKQYTSQSHIAGRKNTIVEVVWPSITLLNGQYLHAKGDVLLATTELNEEVNVTPNSEVSLKGDNVGTKV